MDALSVGCQLSLSGVKPWALGTTEICLAANATLVEKSEKLLDVSSEKTCSPNPHHSQFYRKNNEFSDLKY